MTDDVELRRLAIRRADMKLAFRSHLLAYVMVNAGLVAIYIATGDFGDYFWPIWPMLGWGIGLAAHGASVYMNGEGIRDRLIEEELEKLRRTRGG
ncbi:MAG: 2TM domain-containing protein [Phenylobacterium sp.]|uniref:2TM domain-containing protein n=1 Tax=Phenylobacterium sp. TaxID=1871053 RepID=UPI001A413E96|nr:2TM domain-containing protein [Phenylobacterium sp.]MBL8773411.1 2TM domain-containing protein [Phenylobacterium sp.]